MFEFLNRPDIDDRCTCEIIPDTGDPLLLDVFRASDQVVVWPSLSCHLKDPEIFKLSRLAADDFRQLREFTTCLVERFPWSDVHLRVDGQRNELVRFSKHDTACETLALLLAAVTATPPFTSQGHQNDRLEVL